MITSLLMGFLMLLLVGLQIRLLAHPRNPAVLGIITFMVSLCGGYVTKLIAAGGNIPVYSLGTAIGAILAVWLTAAWDKQQHKTAIRLIKVKLANTPRPSDARR